MTGRLRRFTPDELDPEQTEVHRAITGGPRATGPQVFALRDEEGRLLGPFNAMLLSPPIGGALQALGASVRYGSVLSDRVREMAILVVAAHWGSDFESGAHEAIGRAIGLTEPELSALREGRVPTLEDPRELAAVRVTAAMARAGDLTDEEYGTAVAMLGERALFELSALVGYYATLALQLRIFAGEGGARETDADRP